MHRSFRMMQKRRCSAMANETKTTLKRVLHDLKREWKWLVMTLILAFVTVALTL